VFKRSYRYALVAGAALLVPLVTATAASATWLAGAGSAAGTAGVAGRAATTRAVGAVGAADYWRVTANVQAKNQTIQLSDIAADATNDAWAIGSARMQGQASFQPVVEHWDGRGWHTVTLPGSVLTTLGTSSARATIGASSPANVWAFGMGGYWLHWNGKQWTAGRLARPAAGALGPYVGSPLVFGPSNVWAFGDYQTKAGALVPYGLHYNGQTWKSFTAPGMYGFAAESAVSPDDIWGLMNAGVSGSGDVLTRWDGSRWATKALPATLTSSATLYSILARSDADVWVGGKSRKTGDGVVAHWDGSAWSIDTFQPVKGFPVDALVQMVPDGKNGIWALASCTLGSCWRLWHYTGGQWQGPVQPAINGVPATFVADIAEVPGSTAIWAAGGSSSGTVQGGMIALQGSVPAARKPAPARKAKPRPYYPPPARPAAQCPPGTM
jgi:hypothetical protein